MKYQIIFLHILLVAKIANAYWWYLGLQVEDDKKQVDNAKQQNDKQSQNLFEINKPKFVNGLKRYCRSLRVLNSPVQRRLCLKNDNIIQVIARGAKLAIDECQYQFKFKRWNCTIFKNVNVFGRLVETRTKETAFIHAINSAAAMYEITKSCSRGELKGCSCNKKLQSINQGTGNKLDQNIGRYAWGGCSDNVLFGHRLSKHFVDAKELSGSSRPIRVSDDQTENMYVNKEYKLMNLHNNEVGRRTILKNMKQVCKCHGVSGSCTVKVCWKVMPEFRVIGNELIKRYNLAAQIRDVEAKNRVQKLKMIVSRRSTDFDDYNKKNDLKDDLIFVDKSPNFCRHDAKFNTLGTSGRMCKIIKKENEKSRDIYQRLYMRNSTVDELQDESTLQTCDYLCCGRGYYSKVVEVEEDCDCQFQWCCSVKCKKCKKKIIQYFCN